MRYSVASILFYLLFLNVVSAQENELSEYELEVQKIIENSGAWNYDDVIPSQLQNWKAYGTCMRTISDSIVVFEQINNAKLLVEIVLSPLTDELSSKTATLRALFLVGPSQFYKELVNRISETQPETISDNLKIIIEEAKYQYVMADVVSVLKEGFSESEQISILEEFRHEVESGRNWSDVVREFGELYPRCPKEMRYCGTKIGNWGTVLIKDGKARTYWGATIPDEHINVLRNAKDLSFVMIDNVENEEKFLYRVNENFKGIEIDIK